MDIRLVRFGWHFELLLFGVFLVLIGGFTQDVTMAKIGAAASIWGAVGAAIVYLQNGEIFANPNNG